MFFGTLRGPYEIIFFIKKNKGKYPFSAELNTTPPSLIKVSNGKRIFFTTNYTGLNGEKKYSIQILF